MQPALAVCASHLPIRAAATPYFSSSLCKQADDEPASAQVLLKIEHIHAHEASGAFSFCLGAQSRESHADRVLPVGAKAQAHLGGFI
jgi:hypothetical protein